MFTYRDVFNACGYRSDRDRLCQEYYGHKYCFIRFDNFAFMERASFKTDAIVLFLLVLTCLSLVMIAVSQLIVMSCPSRISTSKSSNHRFAQQRTKFCLTSLHPQKAFKIKSLKKTSRSTSFHISSHHLIAVKACAIRDRRYHKVLFRFKRLDIVMSELKAIKTHIGRHST